MIKDFFQWFMSLGAVQKFEYDKLHFTDIELNHVTVPMLPCLETTTLQGLVDYHEMLHGKCPEEAKELMVHVLTPRLVKLLTWRGHDQNRKRQTHVQASTYKNDFPFDDFMSQESFLIRLNANFVKNDELVKLIKQSSLIKSTVEASEEDDGVSQNVIAKKGVSLSSAEKVKTIVKLQPVTTFNEVEQPESEFVYRVRSASGVEDRPAQFALFAVADTTVDRLGIENVANWLRTALGPKVPIIK